MTTVYIYSNQYKKKLEHTFFQNKHLFLSLETGNQDFFYIKLISQSDLRITIADILSSFIKQNIFPKLLEDTVNKNFRYKKAEREMNQILSFWVFEEGKHKQSILDILNAKAEINIDGYLAFRLKEEKQAIQKMAYHTLKQYETKIEYENFIKLLTNYVESNDETVLELHIAKLDKGYILFDENKNDITRQNLNIFLKDEPRNEINYDDFLLSSLLNILPSKIIIHNNGIYPNKKVILTIRKIFKERVYFCNYCPICTKTVTFLRN